MIPITLNLPEKARVEYNLLTYPMHPNHLVANVLLVRLPHGVSIDVGWYPEDDLDGEFRINAYHQEWENQLRKPIRSKDECEVANIVEQLARSLSNATEYAISKPGRHESQVSKARAGTATTVMRTPRRELQDA